MNTLYDHQLSHIAKYIGAHAYTDDFTFQDQMRRSDLTIKGEVKGSLGAPKAEQIFINGWGQVLSAAYILEKNPSQLKISETFRKTLIEELDRAVAKGMNEANPFFRLNVRGFTKSIMMYPHAGKYFDFLPVPIENPVMYLNQFVKEADLKFSLYEGKLFLKIEPEDQSNIFNKLWETDFSQLLAANGYREMEKNKECPHVTLVNSDVIAKIREQFSVKYGNGEGPLKFEAFFENFLNSQSHELKMQANPVLFTELCSTYSEDYPPFEEVVVAKLEAPFVEKALRSLVVEVEREIGFQIPVKPKSSFHLTIATKYRKPNSELHESIESIIKSTGKYASALTHYFEQLAKA